MDNTDLIAKLKALEAPCRKCDAAIYAIADIPHGKGHRGLEAPCYTASLDAAMMLVPEGLGWKIIKPSFSLECYVETWVDLGNSYPLKRTLGQAPLPAIALCIAALKARAATQNLQEQSHDK